MGINRFQAKINEWEFNPIWIYTSILLYVLIRIMEYTIGQKGNPEWVIDFLPYILPILFVLFDNMLDLRGKNGK